MSKVDKYYDFTNRRNCIAVGTYIKKGHALHSKQFSFDMVTCEARSYSWWCFVLKVGNTIYFNNASYSMQTCQHQSMAKKILELEQPEKFGLKVKYVYIREGLQSLHTAVANLREEISTIEKAMANPKSRKATNKERVKRIAGIRKKIAEYRRLWPIFARQIGENANTRLERGLEAENDRLRATLIKTHKVGRAPFVALKAVNTYGKRFAQVYVMKRQDLATLDLLKLKESGTYYDIEFSLAPVNAPDIQAAVTTTYENACGQFVYERIDNPNAILPKVVAL